MIGCNNPRCNPCHTVDYESGDIAFLYGFLDNHENSTFIDVGAHVGLYVHSLSLSLSPNKKTYRMISIEPDPSVIAILSANTKPHLILPIALWNESTSLYLHKQGNPHGYVKTNPGSDGIPIIASTLDLITRDILPDISALALKVDTEGSEGLILEGAQKTLSKVKSGAMVVEFSVSHFKRYNTDMDKVVADLAVAGYEPVESAVIEQVQQGLKRNVHFVKEDKT